MPEISLFLGIVVGMFYREHGVAHFHAVYGEHEASVEVATWLDNWDLARQGQPLNRILPLE